MVKCFGTQYNEFGANIFIINGNRPLAVGVTMGMVKPAAAMLEYNVWALSMGHRYRECVRSLFAGKWNE